MKNMNEQMKSYIAKIVKYVVIMITVIMTAYIAISMIDIVIGMTSVDAQVASFSTTWSYRFANPEDVREMVTEYAFELCSIRNTVVSMAIGLNAVLGAYLGYNVYKLIKETKHHRRIRTAMKDLESLAK